MRRALIAATIVAIATAACVKQQVVNNSDGSTLPGRSGVGPSLVIEQFMRAVNAKDLARMAQLFGTKDGPIAGRDQREQVEQRMFAIASVLGHEDFEIQGEQLVPGRTTEATRVMVKVTISGKSHAVPFTLVRYKENNWLVEQIGIDVITGPSR